MRQLIIISLILTLMLGSCGKSSHALWQEQYDLGVRYLSEGNYESAILAFTSAIEIDPKRPEPYIGRGDAYIVSGETAENLDAALADYQNALALDESLVDAWLGGAEVYVRQNEYEQALDFLNIALEKTKHSSEIESYISEIESLIPDDVPAEQIYEEFLRSKEYLPYLDQWLYDEPTDYAYCDLSGDEFPELILSGGNGTGFYNFAVFTCDLASMEILPVTIESDIMGSGTVSQYYTSLEYSQKYHALVYTELNNGSLFDSYGFHAIHDQIMTTDFSLSFETDATGQSKMYFYDQNGSSESITQEAFREYMSEPEALTFISLLEL